MFRAPLREAARRSRRVRRRINDLALFLSFSSRRTSARSFGRFDTVRSVKLRAKKDWTGPVSCARAASEGRVRGGVFYANLIGRRGRWTDSACVRYIVDL